MSQEDPQLDLFRKALNFNVIGRYDSQIKQLLFNTNHSVLYLYKNDEWEKQQTQGTLAVYLRDDSKDHMHYGLMILNRSSPENFAIGIVPHSVQRQGWTPMKAEMQGDLIIIKTVESKVYGIWVFNEDDRKRVYTLIEYLMNSPPMEMVQ